CAGRARQLPQPGAEGRHRQDHHAAAGRAPSAGGPHAAAAHRLAHRPHQLLPGLRGAHPFHPFISQIRALHAVVAAPGLI
nr:hypothetical protein [Tanacetum cinerariifolium]